MRLAEAEREACDQKCPKVTVTHTHTQSVAILAQGQNGDCLPDVAGLVSPFVPASLGLSS